MFSSAVRRMTFWLTGGILATIVGAVVYQVLDQQVIAVASGVIFAIAFGMVVEPVIAAFPRRTGVADSLRLPPEPSDDEPTHGGHTGPARVEHDHLPRLPREQRHQHHGSGHAQ